MRTANTSKNYWVCRRFRASGKVWHEVWASAQREATAVKVAEMLTQKMPHLNVVVRRSTSKRAIRVFGSRLN